AATKPTAWRIGGRERCPLHGRRGGAAGGVGDDRAARGGGPESPCIVRRRTTRMPTRCRGRRAEAWRLGGEGAARRRLGHIAASRASRVRSLAAWSSYEPWSWRESSAAVADRGAAVGAAGAGRAGRLRWRRRGPWGGGGRPRRSRRRGDGDAGAGDDGRR